MPPSNPSMSRKASIVGSVPIGNVYVDGLNVGDVGEDGRLVVEEGDIFALLKDKYASAVAAPVSSADEPGASATGPSPSASPKPKRTSRSRVSKRTATTSRLRS